MQLTQCVWGVVFLGACLIFSILGCGTRPIPAETHGKTHKHPPVELVGVWYTVEPGDTIYGISKKYGVPPEDLIELNGLHQPDKLTVGQPLFLYGIDKLVDNLESRVPRVDEPNSRKTRFVWPLKGGVLTSGFGPRGGRKHKGIDIAARTGTPIYAAASGVVVYSDNKQRGYGNLVIIRHPARTMTVYAHNHRNLVDEGERVRQGSQIAEVGNTGRSTGPHLHFEIRIKGRAVDPIRHLPRK